MRSELNNGEAEKYSKQDSWGNNKVKNVGAVVSCVGICGKSSAIYNVHECRMGNEGECCRASMVKLNVVKVGSCIPITNATKTVLGNA
ncbi:hypothetical protein PV327_011091 [Microctonus hyperodae]|uniref:Uncharacterized protein n=1 Tax=Microctonus hyperodae TaxID=165561 RepID=A0AA39FR21_MICHY|nr:hypothetical protein PV327_011091 [Microctonus hyperodae]